MSKQTLMVLLTAVLLGGPLAVVCVPDAGAVAFSSCPHSPGFSCARVPVPLDRSGKVPGSIALHLERKLAGPGPSRDAVIALAGGPGQASLPLGEFIAKAVTPALSVRDLLVFDQRGTGSSSPLSCRALASSVAQALGTLIARCAQQI